VGDWDERADAENLPRLGRKYGGLGGELGTHKPDS